MLAVRRAFALFCTLVIGVFIGTKGWSVALLILLPMFIFLLMIWDEKSYYKYLKNNQSKQYEYRK